MDRSTKPSGFVKSEPEADHHLQRLKPEPPTHLHYQSTNRSNGELGDASNGKNSQSDTDFGVRNVLDIVSPREPLIYRIVALRAKHRETDWYRFFYRDPRKLRRTCLSIHSIFILCPFSFFFFNLISYFLVSQVKSIDVNRYATKKTIAQGMLDIALLTANASQLKYILQVICIFVVSIE